VEHTNMQQKYVEIGRDCIFTYFWHHTFRPNNSNGNGKTLVLTVLCLLLCYSVACIVCFYLVVNALLTIII